MAYRLSNIAFGTGSLDGAVIEVEHSELMVDLFHMKPENNSPGDSPYVQYCLYLNGSDEPILHIRHAANGQIDIIVDRDRFDAVAVELE